MRLAAALVVCAAAFVAGCHDPVTEVVVVVTSDLLIPNDVDQATIGAAQGSSAPGQFSSFGVTLPPQFPLSIGFEGNQTSVFSITIQLTRFNNTVPTTEAVITRSATGIPFVPHEIRMLVFPMVAACSCHGTNCPLPGTNPDCDDLANPETVPLDPAIAPPPGPSGPGVMVFNEPGGLETK